MGKAKSGPLRMTKTCSLLCMLGLTTGFFFVEIIVGYITNSMALIADSFHMLSDVISLIVGFLALRYSKKSKTTEQNTFGWQRAEVLGALINAVFLVALCFTILIEGLKRLIELQEIEQPMLVLIVGSAGLAVNLIGLCMFHGHGHGHSHGGNNHGHSHKHSGMPAIHGTTERPATTETIINNINSIEGGSVIDLSDGRKESVSEFEGSYLKDAHEIQKFATVIVREKSVDLPECSSDQEESNLHKEKVTTSAQMNMRAVYLHVMGDALGSVIVIASALCMLYGEGKWRLYVDPCMSIIMVLIIMKSSVPLLKESALILMQTVPTHIKIQEVQNRLLQQVEGVLSLHEFHVWQLAGDKIIASAHITCRSMAEYMPIANKIKDFFHDEGIHSTTIQPEFLEEDPPDIQEQNGCVLDCGTDNNCGAAQRCCPGDFRLRKVVALGENDNAETRDTDRSATTAAT